METKTNPENQNQSNLKFLFLLKLHPKDDVAKIISLKKGSIILTFICCLVSFFQLIFDYKYTKYFCIICPFFNICLCGSLNIVSFIFFFKAYKINDKYQIYMGNLAIAWSFIIHSIIFIFDIIFNFSFSPIDLFFIFEKTNFRFLSFILPNIIFLLFELYVAFICYSYIKQILEQHDDLINGKSKVQENMEIPMSNKINNLT